MRGRTSARPFFGGGPVELETVMSSLHNEATGGCPESSGLRSGLLERILVFERVVGLSSQWHDNQICLPTWLGGMRLCVVQSVEER